MASKDLNIIGVLKLETDLFVVDIYETTSSLLSLWPVQDVLGMIAEEL